MTWYHLGEGSGAIYDHTNRPAAEHGTPVVVIDPEDREAVERLFRTYASTVGVNRVEALQAALREYANPTPPKPEEPTDPAVRVTAAGTRWARVGPWWLAPDLSQPPRTWDYLIEQEDFRGQ